MCRICIADVWVRSSVNGCGLAALRGTAARRHASASPRRRKWFREIERVLHVARRMVGRHVERFEVVVVVLDLGAFEHLIAETREDLLHLLADEAERMPRSEDRPGAPGA